MNMPIASLSLFARVALLSLAPALLVAQTRPTPGLPSAPSTSLGIKAPATMPRTDPELKPYESCSFPDGLQITDVAPMPDDVRARPVQAHGVTRQVPLLAGRRITFAYPGAKPYASAKVELLPAENWLTNRKLLLDDFDDIANSDKTVARNKTRQPTLSSFSVVGLDRMTVVGDTLGIYMLLDDKTHVATTVYLLNPQRASSKHWRTTRAAATPFCTTTHTAFATTRPAHSSEPPDEPRSSAPCAGCFVAHGTRATRTRHGHG